MAINHADGMMLASVVACPIAAPVAAAHAGAGWWTVLFIPAGLGIGLGVSYAGQRLVYPIMGFGLSRTSQMPKSWMKQIAFVPFFLLYVILPLAIFWAAVLGTWTGSIWMAKHLL